LKLENDTTIGLLDVLTLKSNCDYASYLHFLDYSQRAVLVRYLNKIPLKSASLCKWNDALNTLFQTSPQKTQEPAKKILMQLLYDADRKMPLAANRL